MARFISGTVTAQWLAGRQTRSSLQGLMAEFLSEIEALQVDRDEWREKAEEATQTLDFERARARKQLRMLRAAVEADMADGRREVQVMNPVGAARVRAWIEAERGRSLRWLAGNVDVSHNHLGLVLRGEREPSRDLLERIAGVTGIDLDDLLPVVQAVAS